MLVKKGMMALSAALALAGGAVRLPDPPKPRRRNSKDLERMEAAKEKRQRKAERRKKHASSI